MRRLESKINTNERGSILIETLLTLPILLMFFSFLMSYFGALEKRREASEAIRVALKGVSSIADASIYTDETNTTLDPYNSPSMALLFDFANTITKDNIDALVREEITDITDLNDPNRPSNAYDFDIQTIYSVSDSGVPKTFLRIRIKSKSVFASILNYAGLGNMFTPCASGLTEIEVAGATDWYYSNETEFSQFFVLMRGDDDPVC